LALLGVVVVVMAVMAAPAFAADSVYWGNYDGTTISHANLDGSGGGGDLSMTGATVSGPYGTAIDAAADKIYWANDFASTISVANLDGTGAHDLPIPSADVNGPGGVAIDPATGKLYWGNDNSTTIGFANLDGSGAGLLNTTGATASEPDGVAIDPAANKIYWANQGDNTHPVSFANLDDTGGGGDLDVTGAPATSDPTGVAIDPGTGRIYWGDQSAGINFANLNDTGGGGGLDTSGATISSPQSVAIDPTTGRIYWANFTAGISFANADNSGGGGDLSISGATPDHPVYPALLRAPSPAGAPTVGGVPNAGSTLSCSRGTWGADYLGSFLYRAPQSFGYQWSLNGAAIAGATSASYTPTSIGSYTCRVTATNFAGSADQASAAVTVGTKPTASTAAASSVGAGGAVLNGTVNPEDLSTVYHFDYGTSPAYGSRVPASDAGVGSDATGHAVSRSVSGLLADTTYHFRVVATNAAGTTYGSDQMLTTTAAVLSGLRVSPHKLSIAGRKVHGKCVKPTGKNDANKHCERLIKLKVRYTLNAASAVTFTLKVKSAGRKAGGKCVKPTNKNEHTKTCARLVTVHGKLVKTGTAGVNSFVWNGKLGGYKLRPGTYQVTATPSAGKPQRIMVRIVG
jgi:DNA-binding beta-propeller fold protein YncE